MTTIAQRGSAPATEKPKGDPAYATLSLAIICISYFMVILDNSIVFTGLPQIRSDLGFSETGLSWITNAYVLVFGGLLLLGPGRVTCSGTAGCSCPPWSSSRSPRFWWGPPRLSGG
ncbi:hypothetical protein [Streptomyces sp. NPDC046978]|uniref:hypothetical protein n=1 Tax=Streptomyces sp. NPDC046978 TaxID=3154704 RepID=UPI0033C69584